MTKPDDSNILLFAEWQSRGPLRRLKIPEGKFMVALVHDFPFTQELVVFESDGFRLEGVLHRPVTHSSFLVIGSHGLLGNGDSPKQIDLAYHLNSAGISFFRFDHRGCGTSQGDFEEGASLNSRVCDLRAAAECLGRQAGFVAQMGLFGSSLGGTACLAAAEYLAPRCMVTLAAPVDSRALHAANRLAPEEARLSTQLMARLDFDLRCRLGAIGHLLIVHGEQDGVVPVDHARTLYARCREPKKLLVLPQADHRIARAEHRQQFVQAAGKWFMDLGLAP